VLIAGALAAASCGSGGAAVSVPLRLRGAQGSRAGVQALVEVRVGDGPEVPVVLDTGSIGLHIYPQAVDLRAGSGVTPTGQPTSITYVDGEQQTGTLATARISIGGVTTATAVPFGIISSLTCTAEKPRCPAQGGIAAAVAAGRYGVLGIGLGRRDPSTPPNPLLYLPDPYRRSWSISLNPPGGRLVLGAQASQRPAAVIRLPREADPANGGKAFDDHAAHVCWRIGGLSSCQPTLFDSGEFTMQVFGGRLGAGWSALGTATRVPAGARVAASLRTGDGPFWSFTAGRAPSANLVVAHAQGRGAVNTGVAAFFAFAVLYDAVDGVIRLEPRR